MWLRQDYDAGLIQGVVHTELEVDVTRGWTDHLPWSHVEGGARLRGYSVSAQRVEAYLAGKKRVTRSSDWSPVVSWKRETRHRSVMIDGTPQWRLSGVGSRPLRLDQDSGGSTR